MAGRQDISVLGVFVADTTYRADRAPRLGETILGRSFALGPGGKGSNQAVAAARLGASVNFISKLGDDDFADLAIKTWQDAGVHPFITRDKSSYTGAAYIFVEEKSGDNAIIVCPGAAATISASDVLAYTELIEQSAVFVTQLEQPIEAAITALTIARAANVTTILNPAPAAALDNAMLALCDFITPNETEAAALTGLPVESVEQAKSAADALLDKGVGTVIITLGENGALLHGRDSSHHIPAIDAGPVVETTGAGDAFNGALAAALAEGQNPLDAVCFACKAASISVTRSGAAQSMPSAREVSQLTTDRHKST